MKSPHKGSILLYSHDGFGLGHVRRNLNIAIQAVQEMDTNALLLMSHNSIPFLPNLTGIDFIKLPSILKVAKDQWTPRTLSMDPEAFKQLRSGLIQNTIEHFSPSLFLVDYMPAGVWGELLPIFPLLKERKIPIVLGLRDILDAPEVTKEQWKQDGIYEMIDQFYDHILIYGAKDIFNTQKAYGLPAKKVHYTGYLSAQASMRSKEAVKKEFGFDERPLVVVTAGGGNDAFPMMQRCMRALEILSKTSNLQALFVAGPLMNPQQKGALELNVGNLPIRVIPHSDDLIGAMQAADLLITMGSYNTLVEAVRLGKPTLAIPREGPSLEQKMRCDLFAELGLIRTLPSPLELDSTTLSESIAALLKDPFQPKKRLDLDGRKETCNLLKQFIFGEVAH